MKTDYTELGGNLLAKGIKPGIVVARFNDFFTKELLAGALDGFIRHGVAAADITVAWVPGSNELPMAAQRLIQSGHVDCVVALGVVVQGATPHADLINTQVSRSLAGLALELKIPVINAVVTAENLDQAIERCGTKAGNKGWQGAQAAIEMVNLFRAMDGLGA